MSETEELPASFQELVELAEKLVTLTQGRVDYHGKT